MKPKNEDELEKLLLDHGYLYPFRSNGYLRRMLQHWPENKRLLTIVEAAQFYAYGKDLFSLEGTELISRPKEGRSVTTKVWPIFADEDAQSKSRTTATRSEGDKLFSFFFPGMKMSDPDKLPPPPKILGRSWDSIADE